MLGDRTWLTVNNPVNSQIAELLISGQGRIISFSPFLKLWNSTNGVANHCIFSKKLLGFFMNFVFHDDNKRPFIIDYSFNLLSFNTNFS